MKGFEIKSFVDFDFSLAKMPMIVVYDSPSEFPSKFVARLFNVDIPTNYFVTADTLEELRKKMPFNMIRTGRSPQDDIIIVETWF